ncbi:glutathione S-transferase [Gluconacetobacter azotocaptans]|uniref:Glutathione S-transferase n=1 Tax=Gluconacetobacter azotocaptans TaxID=142834 RepID=A0A7W4JS39_9PROT|nr:glutathione S-transferase N-terminal domain-containing protein [Gluconacetobacter azotocaptans]MBB2189896.1 glutathione S-transferase [Gluconacetobacter azotocaptans]MBM9403711.1 glutathione S-transferase N-terminal domain-containing protein [Gluconacetobacter azotocaptans]GBQ35601.1 glutathione S-transferase [Gluconacetobacter azotocaptans DSM 13594]
MKLYHASLSPFARKVRAAIIALGLEDRIEEVVVNISAAPPDVLAANPLCKIPTLEIAEGEGVYDSPVIVEYLDALAGGGVIPAAGPERWRALRLQALGDGIADAAVLWRGLAGAGLHRDDPLVQRQAAAIRRSLDRLEAAPPPEVSLAGPVDVGILSVACALGYLDVRFADDPWRDQRPALAAWYETASRHDCLARTAVSSP